MFMRAVVSRSFWGWTREIRPVNQSVTMHPSREIVPARGDSAIRGGCAVEDRIPSRAIGVHDFDLCVLRGYRIRKCYLFCGYYLLE